MLNLQAKKPGSLSTVLVIDNEQNMFEVMMKQGNVLGIQTIHATSLQDGLNKCRDNNFEILLVRDKLPDGAACYAVQDLLTKPNSPEIVIYTTMGDPDQIEYALQRGVFDYIIDPEPENSLPELLKRVLQYRKSKTKDSLVKENEITQQLSSQGIIGHSKMMQNCLNLATRISQSDSNVLITGESGTGKELFASAIHNFSSRARKHMTIVDCASLPPTLVESILFGHARGSFTGADKTQPGLIKQSDGGTLFLDEIGEIPPEIQKKFLRVIQERKYRPVGSEIEIKSDFRLIAATNKDLQAMTEDGSFRSDLLFRLRTFQLELPPLRTRTADITELAYYYRDKFCKRNKLKKKKFSPDYLMILTQYEWPGNVRELFQAIERSIAYAQHNTTLYPKHLPPGIRIQVTKMKLQGQRTANSSVSQSDLPQETPLTMPTLKEARDRVIETEEKKYLKNLLAMTAGNIKQCCKVSGLSRSRLYDLLKKYQLK